MFTLAERLAPILVPNFPLLPYEYKGVHDCSFSTIPPTRIPGISTNLTTNTHEAQYFLEYLSLATVL